VLAPRGPQLKLTSSPPGAQVFVNGVAQPGQTPLTLSGLKAGVPYDVRLELAGFEVASKSVKLDDSRRVIVVPVTLTPAAREDPEAPRGDPGAAP
jgi:hypothetical protein